MEETVLLNGIMTASKGNLPNLIDSSVLTPVQQFYSGKSIFITGATGFVGKTLLEKLLRCCSEMKIVYLLLRPKKGLTSLERVDKLMQAEIFNNTKEMFPDLKSKICVIEGDILQPRLGMSEEQEQELIENVEVVFHSAARVLWDDPLKIAAEHNVRATGDLLKFLKQFKKLEAFVHVSTSYVHREPDLTVPERVTPTKVTPSQLLSILDWLDDETLKAITPFVVREKNNTYLFTKALAEQLLQEERGSIPLGIVRPCNVSPTWQDPIPGWGDTIQGPQGLFLAAAKGFLRTMYTFPHLKINLVPVDTLVNTLVTTAWHISVNKPKDVYVVNCVLDYERLPLAGGVMLAEVLKKRDKYPLASIYRYPDFTLYHNKWFYYFHAIFDHYIPAIIGDTVLFVVTGKTLMIRMYRKINFLFSVFLEVGEEPWICDRNNYKAVMNSLSEKDSKMFNMDTDNLDWYEYIDDMLLTGRRILGREDPSNIPYAKKKAKIWWSVTTTLKWCTILYFTNYFLSPYIF